MAMRANTRSVSDGSAGVEAETGIAAGVADRAGHVVAGIGAGCLLAVSLLNIEPNDRAGHRAAAKRLQAERKHATAEP